MRVLVRVNSLELGGTQINAVDLAAAMRRHGVESHLLGPRATIPDGPSLFDIASRRGVPLEAYDPPEGTVPHARELSRRAREVGADLVHVYGTFGAARPTYWGPCLLGRRPWVHTVYEMAVDPVVHPHVPLVVGTGYLVDDLRDRPGITTLVSPPVDLDQDRPGVPGTDELLASLRSTAPMRVVVVSRLSELMKSVALDAVIDAMELLARPDVVLLLVGTGDAEPRLRRRAQEVNDRLGWTAVELLGALADPAPAYDCADVMVGMGSSAARSLAFGKPLVVQGEFGWSGLFDESSAATMLRNSFWSPEVVAEPAAPLAATLAALLDDPERRAVLGAFGRTTAQSRFGLTAMAERMAEVYREAAAGYGSATWLADLGFELRNIPEMIRRRAGGRRASGVVS